MKFSTKFIKAGNEMCEFEKHVNAPYMRKKFTIPFKPEKAEITICGLGFYELYINGKNITKGPLAPYINNTDDICYYDNYDITDLLSEGDNAVGIILGNGFRNCLGGYVWDFDKSKSRGPVTAALCIEAKNGEKLFEMEADESFKTHPSPITFDDLRMGCRYDARLETDNWCMADFDDSAWQNALIGETPSGEAKLCGADPIRVFEELLPVKTEHFDSLPFLYENNAPDAKPIEGCCRENVYVFDFGVNTSGVTKFKINGKKGQKITIRHGECNCGDKFSMYSIGFFRSDLETKYYVDYNQTDEYICKGGEEEFIPKFKYDGFQYAYVEGLEADQVKEDTLTYLVMHSDLKERAGFECSDEVLNKLQECTRRSDLANFNYFPTDCPHREKNGWTGDASMSSEHMLLNLTAEKSLREWLFSIRKAQALNGSLPGIVPTGGWGFEWGNGPAWDSVCVNLPYYIYKFTGDKEIIRENATLIMRYLTYISGRRDENGLVHIGLGDWVDPFEEEKGFITAPLEVTDSIMVYDIAKKASFLFDVAGYKNESEYAGLIAAQMRESIREHLIDGDTLTVKGDCQTSQAFALETGIFNDDEIKAAQRKLVEIIHRDGDINTCGMIGLRHVFHALTNAGESELAYKIITGKTRTCYGYWIANGANTLWESFPTIDAAQCNSKNHHFLGDISSWFIGEIAGIKPNPDCRDIHRFEISPKFLKKLDYAKAHYNSPFGRVEASWKRSAEAIELCVSLPENTSARIVADNGYCFDGAVKAVEVCGEYNGRLVLHKCN